jgi:endo-1,4-beta-xylanase
MFQKLAATGKLVKISELDVKVGTDAPTPAQLEAQANVYKQVVDLYVQHVPESQRYGITLWGITDADSWITGDAPCLWLKGYVRKHAYKGFADGLAGRDVSEEFTGELIY